MENTFLISLEKESTAEIVLKLFSLSRFSSTLENQCLSKIHHCHLTHKRSSKWNLGQTRHFSG